MFEETGLDYECKICSYRINSTYYSHAEKTDTEYFKCKVIMKV